MSHLTRSSSMRRNRCVQARSDGQIRASGSSGSASAQPWTAKAVCQMAAEPSWPCREPMARMCSGIAALHDSRSGACSRPGLCAGPGRGRRCGPDTPRRRLFCRASHGPWTSCSTLRATLTSRSRTRPQPSQPPLPADETVSDASPRCGSAESRAPRPPSRGGRGRRSPCRAGAGPAARR